MKKLRSLFRGFVYALPVVLFFSYFPVFSLGENESMNFELSLPLLWLVVFDILGFVVLALKGRVFKSVKDYWWIFLFPVWGFLTTIWSLNLVRGVLVAGILGLIALSAFLMWSLRDEFKGEFKRKFFKWYLISAVLVSLWCVVQCILDIVGISSDYTLLCTGCTYTIFGFPHPNGFAAEPQFMGNLLLAPIIIAMYLFITKQASRFKIISICLFVMMMALFLTLSRGAIYAFVLALVFMTAIMIWKRVKKMTDWSMKRLGLVWGVFVVSFLFALNMQGVMAEVSKTDDTYYSGVSKVINQLSLGVIDLGGNQTKKDSNVDLPQMKEAEKNEILEYEKANFDGYVEVSTKVRLNSSRVALKAWSEDWKRGLFGAGLGSASIVMHEKGVFSTPKEIINNQYISILLETGLVGVGLIIITGVLIIRKMIYGCKERLLIVTIIAAYAVSLFFFSGLPNALHIYLITGILIAISGAYSRDFRKKLVS